MFGLEVAVTPDDVRCVEARAGCANRRADTVCGLDREAEVTLTCAQLTFGEGLEELSPGRMNLLVAAEAGTERCSAAQIVHEAQLRSRALPRVHAEGLGQTHAIDPAHREGVRGDRDDLGNTHASRAGASLTGDFPRDHAVIVIGLHDVTLLADRDPVRGSVREHDQGFDRVRGPTEEIDRQPDRIARHPATLNP